MVSRLRKDIQDADIPAALPCCNPYAVPEILHSHSTGAGACDKDITAIKLLKALPVKPHISLACLLHRVVALGKGGRVAHNYIVGAGAHHLQVLKHIPIHSLNIALFLGNLIEANHLLEEREGPVRDIHTGHLHCPARRCGKGETARVAEEVQHLLALCKCAEGKPGRALVQEEACLLAALAQCYHLETVLKEYGFVYALAKSDHRGTRNVVRALYHTFWGKYLDQRLCD